MIVSKELGMTLAICSGLYWTLTYILIIIKGFKDKTYGMPVLALCANISWEFIFSFIYTGTMSAVQVLINKTWFFFDIIILYQVFKYGDSLFHKKINKKIFRLLLPLILFSSFMAILTIIYEFNDVVGKYTAFSQNLMMSILFVGLLLQRNNSRGQSLYIAVFKMLGTIFPSILFYLLFPESYFLIFLYIMIFIFDLAYVALLFNIMKKEKRNPILL